MGGSSGDTNIPLMPIQTPGYSSPGGSTLNSNPTNPFGGTVNFGYQGLPYTFPNQSLGEGYQNIQNLYGQLGEQAPNLYSSAIDQSNNILNNQSLPQIQGIYGQGLGTQQGLTGQGLAQSQGITNQSSSDLSSLMNNYDQNYLQQLGPTGNLGQQLSGEFQAYGLTPNSGAFQTALGNTLGQLGAQNQYTLGSNLVNQGSQAQQNLLSQGLGGQLSTAQQGTQQAGQLANLGGVQNMTLASEGTLSPLDYENQAAGLESGIINQAAELPINYWGSQQNQNFANQLSQNNINAQNSSSQNQLLGNILGSGIGAAGLAASK